MTETESKIVQLLKSDEDCNKILGLMLGRNELGVEGLLDLIDVRLHKNNGYSTEITIGERPNEHSYYIFYGKNLKYNHQYVINGGRNGSYLDKFNGKLRIFNLFLNKVTT